MSEHEPVATMVDVAFALQGRFLPREHRFELAAALARRLPWLGQSSGAGMHRLNVAAGGGPMALLSNRTRLTLRVPRDRADETAALSGSELVCGPATVRLGAAQVRELLPWGTLYSHVVAAEDDDENAFLLAVGEQLEALGVRARAICGRHQTIEGGALHGYSLMLDGLSARDALRLLEMGLGRHRHLGCGMFVPHKSAAAVGTPP
jgi:CRISPR-associated protein Cas6